MSEQDTLNASVGGALAAMDDALNELGLMSAELTTLAHVVAGAASSGDAAAMNAASEQLSAKAASLEASVVAARTAMAAVPAPTTAGANGGADPSIPAVTLTFDPTTMPGATLGAGFVQQVNVSGGAAPYQFSIGGGALPPGLALAAGGMVSGVPSQAGDFPFTVQAHDANTSGGAQDYTLSVADPATAAQNTGGAGVDQGAQTGV